jgi:RNA polymerase sigma-70 factor (ECF subfamily)
MTRPTRPPRIDGPTADALRRGDPRAFEALYVQLRGDVYNLAARIVGDRREAEDITQDVFLRAFRHLPGKADQVRPEAWVFRTTVNACYDHLRRRTPVPVDAQDDRTAAATDTYAQAATAAAVEETLGRLEPRYRTALVLKDLHGLGNGEIAEIMGVASGTVGVLLFRARAAFKKRYRDVAPTLGAGLPAAGLAVWLPPLALPASLATAPAFTTPVAGPLPGSPAALAPLAPLAAATPPLATGLAKLASALTTKIAVVAIAATAVTGGGIVAYETHDADHAAPTGAAATAPAQGHDDVASHHDGEPSHGKTHASLAAEDPRHDGHGGGHDGSASGDAVGDAAHSGDGTHDGDGSGDNSGGTHTGDGPGDSSGGTHTGDGSGDSSGGTHTGDGSGDSSGGTDGTSGGGGGTTDGTHAGDGGH